MGAAILVVGVVIAIAVAVLYALLSTSHGAGGFVFAVALLLVIGVGCNQLLRRGRQMRAADARRQMALDDRAAVVYLRSFDDDERRYRTSYLFSKRKRRSSVAEIGTGRFATYEEHLSHTLRAIGPVVAVGDPRDALPDLGASRMYVDGGDWQREVLGLLASAQLVVVQVGGSEGLAWEVRQVIDRVEPERVLLTVPLDGSRAQRPDEARYRAFREQFGALFPKGLPEDSGRAQFVSFTADWTPSLFVPGDRRDRAPLAAAGSTASTRALDVLGRDFREYPLRYWARIVFGTLLVLILGFSIFAWIAISGSESDVHDLVDTPSAEPAWVRVEPAGGSFSARFPARPTRDDYIANSPDGLSGRAVEFATVGGAFDILYVDYPANQIGEPTHWLQTRVRLAVKAIPLTHVRARPMTLNGFPGIAVSGRRRVGSKYILEQFRMYVVGSRTYLTTTTTTDAYDASRFLNSFRLRGR